MKVFGHAVILASALRACLAVFTQISMVEVPFGGTVSLPCIISANGGGERDVKWEAMGKDVASFLDGQLVAGKGYEGRVGLHQSHALEGDFSLTLTNAVMSDTDMYECLWQGRKTITMVTLTVLPPPFPDAHTVVMEGEDVTLPCFGKMSKNKPWENMYIQWLRDDKQILLLESGKFTMDGGSWSQSLPSKGDVDRGNFSLSIKSARVLDQGVYRCLYKANDFQSPQSGHPVAYSLTVSGVYPVPSESPLFPAVPSTTTHLTELTVDTNTDSTAEQDAVEVISELPPQARMTSDPVGLIAGATADRTTEQNLPEASPLFPAVPSTTTHLTELTVDTNTDSTAEQDAVEVFQTFTTDDTTALMEKVVGVTENTKSSTNMEFTGILTHDREDSTTVLDPLRVISELPPQARIIAGAVPDSTTQQSTIEVISELPLQARMTSDLIGIIAHAHVDSTTEQNHLEVFQTFTADDTTDLMENALGVTGNTKSSIFMEFTGLMPHDREDSTTIQDSVAVISELPPQTTMTTELDGLMAGVSVDSTTEVNHLEVSETFTTDLMEKVFGVTGNTKSSTSMEFPGLITHDREGSTTVQDSVAVISELPPQTTELLRLITGVSVDSTTEVNHLKVSQTFTTDLMEKDLGVTENTKSSTNMELTGLIPHDLEDSTTVQHSVGVISELPSQARMTSDLVGLFAGAIADSTTEQNHPEGDGYPSDVLWEEKVPWICIGIVSGVILVTAVFLGTLVILGKL